MSKKDNDMIKMLGRTLAMPCLLILTLIALNFYDKASNLFLSSSLAMTLFFIFYLFININSRREIIKLDRLKTIKEEIDHLIFIRYFHVPAAAIFLLFSIFTSQFILPAAVFFLSVLSLLIWDLVWRRRIINLMAAEKRKIT